MNNIKKYREEQNLSLSELAQKTGFSVGYICHLEKGTRNNPTYSAMKKIANELGRNIEEIFY